MRSASIATAMAIKSRVEAPAWGRRLTIGGIGGVLIFAPLAYGAVHPWAYFTIGLVVSALSLSVLAAAFYDLRTKASPHRPLPYPVLWWVGAGFALLILLQTVSWPQGLVNWLSPSAWQVRALGNGFGLAAYLPLSLNSYATGLEGLKLWPAMGLFFLLIFTVKTRQQILGLTGVILAAALFEVVYGFSHFRTHVIWGWQNHYTGGRLCGTFVNSNHLAIFLAMAILLGFGLFLTLKESPPLQAERAPGLASNRRWSRSEHLEPRFRRFLLLFLLLVMAVGLIFTGSRGGMLSLGVGFAMMALLIVSQSWERGHILTIIVFLAAAFLYSLYLGSAIFLERFQDVNDNGRYHTFKAALAIFRQYPWLGSGVATFGDLFYRYEPRELNATYYIYAHNDWLQLLAETGVVGFSLMAVAWIVFFSNLARQWRRRQNSFARGFALGGMAALAAGVFHALLDFPFHIPALSLLFASIAALTYLAVYHNQRGGRDYISSPTLKFPVRHRPALAALILGLGAVQLAYGVQVCYYWMAEYAAPTAINSTRISSQPAMADLERALALTATNSKDHLGLAATVENASGGDKSAILLVEKSLKAAVFYAPANWDYHLRLAEFYLNHIENPAGPHITMALNELGAAVDLFPESAALHFRLASVLDWAEKYHSASVPGPLQQKRAFHFEQAIRLDPGLKKYLN
jgi:putative inorganic carbon (hco3(-)) transporter